MCLLRLMTLATTSSSPTEKTDDSVSKKGQKQP